MIIHILDKTLEYENKQEVLDTIFKRDRQSSKEHKLDI